MEYRFSNSLVKVYKMCSFRFYCKVTDQEQDTEQDNSYGDAGNAVHNTMEYYFTHLIDVPLDLAMIELKNHFNSVWEKYNINNISIDKDEYWLAVINCVKLDIHPTAMEHEFKLSVPFDFIGYADVLSTTEHWIGDWKTSTYKAQKLEAYKDQLRFYAYAYYREHGVVPMTWVFFAKSNKIFKFQFPLENVLSVEKELKNIALEIEQRFKEMKFERNPCRNNCYFCPYKGICSTDLLRANFSEDYEIKMHQKKKKLLVEGAIPDIIHRKIEHELNYEMKNARFIIQAMKAKGVTVDGIKRIWKRRDFGGETIIGYMSTIHQILKDYSQSKGMRLKTIISDYRDQDVMTDISRKMPEKLDIPFDLYKFQNEAVDTLIKHRWGICEIGTGGGKTVIAAECIRRLKTKTLFVIDNKDLLMQTKDEYEKMLGVECGIVGMGHRDWDKPIVLATIQTLAKYIKEFSAQLSYFNLTIYDECLDARTWIITEEGRKHISQIVNEKYQGKVLSYNLNTNKFEWNNIIGWLQTEKIQNYYEVKIRKKTQLKKLIMTGEHKLYINGEYKQIKKAKIGDKVKYNLSSHEGCVWSKESKENRSYEGNPMYKGHRRNEKRITVCGEFKYEHQKVFCENFGLEFIPNGFLIHHLDFNPKNNIITNLLLMSDWEHKSYHNNPKSKIDLIQHSMNIQELRINEFKKLKKPIKIDERTEVIRYLNEGEIVAINEISEDKGRYFYDIEVENNHNFFANGVLSSNCHQIATKSFELLSKALINTKYRFGFTATARRDDGEDNIIFAHNGPVIFKLPASILIDMKLLINPECYFYEYENKLMVGDSWQNEYNDSIVDNPFRNQKIFDIVEKYKALGCQIMILCKLIKHCEMFHEKIVGSELIYGQTDDDVRYDTLEDFKAGKIQILVGNIKIFNKGLNIKNLDVVINAAGNAGEVVTVQTVGRALRKNPGKETAYYIDFIDSGEYCHKHSLSRIQALKNEDYTVKIVRDLEQNVREINKDTSE